MQAQGGQVLAGKYRLVSLLSAGGMGRVWSAEHLGLRSLVAIKLLDDELVSSPDAITRFMREARAAAQLRSPHIVQILDVGIEGDCPFIAMELLEGETLEQRLSREVRLSARETARILTHVARGLTRAHQAGVVHRDLKPSNIFLVRNEDEEVAKVVDFGIAKALDPLALADSLATRAGVLLGSPHYMSPEQAEGQKVDHRTDVWSLGVVAFECLTGAKPFNEHSLGSQLLAICTRAIPVPSSLAIVPEGFDAWFERACARAASQRFTSVQEAAHSLRELCAHDTSEPVARSALPSQPKLSLSPPPVTPRASSPVDRRRRPPAWSVGLLAASLCGLVVLIVRVLNGPTGAVQSAVPIPLPPKPHVAAESQLERPASIAPSVTPALPAAGAAGLRADAGVASGVTAPAKPALIKAPAAKTKRKLVPTQPAAAAPPATLVDEFKDDPY